MASLRARLEARLRLARPDDTEFLLDLSEHVFRRYLAGARANMVRTLRTPGCSVLVAEDDLRLGFAVIHLRKLARAFGPWDRPSTAHLDAIAVRPSLEGRGVGGQLLAGAEELARAGGARSMSLLTAEGNTSARQLFQRAGYGVVGPLGPVYEGGQRGVAMMKPL